MAMAARATTKTSLASVQFRSNATNFHDLFVRPACRRTMSSTRDDDDALVCGSATRAERRKIGDRGQAAAVAAKPEDSRTETERESVVT